MTTTMKSKPQPITFSKITKAISNYLRENYPEVEDRIYLQYPESNFTMPAFVLRTSGGNYRSRISQGYASRGIAYERFTLEYYSLDIADIQQVAYELRVLMNTVVADDGDRYRCYNKNAMIAITENHVSLTFRVNSEPFVEDEPLPKMTSLDLQENIY